LLGAILAPKAIAPLPYGNKSIDEHNSTIFQEVNAKNAARAFYGAKFKMRCFFRTAGADRSLVFT
jgi:hypothetical protein